LAFFWGGGGGFGCFFGKGGVAEARSLDEVKHVMSRSLDEVKHVKALTKPLVFFFLIFSSFLSKDCCNGSVVASSTTRLQVSWHLKLKKFKKFKKIMKKRHAIGPYYTPRHVCSSSTRPQVYFTKARLQVSWHLKLKKLKKIKKIIGGPYYTPRYVCSK
jgi:hypothetical protein